MAFGTHFFVIKNYFLSLVLLLVLSCASTGSFTKLDSAVERTHYAESIELLEEKKYSLYSAEKDSVLYFLDKGMLSHYAGQYEESSALLESGERAIETAFTKSVSRDIGSYLLNDNMLEYPGEDYEDIYINTFNALNYYHRGEIEDALVEIRRMNNKLAYLATKYDLLVSELQQKALEEKLTQIPANPNAPAKFTDSALARYLGMLFYRADGLYDDARIDNEWLRLAFANAPQVYKHSPPSSIANELNIPKGKARFNIIAFSGLSPVKRSMEMRIPLPGSRWVKIALPELEHRRSEVTRIEAAFDHGESFNLELLEDLNAVAGETFKTRKNIIYLKSIIRATVKGLSSSVLDSAAKEAGGETGAILGLLSFITQIFAETSEQADLRISRYFPARAYVGGINLEPGVYSFTIKYYGGNNREITSLRYTDMPIAENVLNLAEAVCLK
ncbi:hypothetical protein AGMMS50293_25870 [Spirochaetia bacterium]|nr:hypothetical protein AGMMS50293_25870 [Spirochaetia bacterium]